MSRLVLLLALLASVSIHNVLDTVDISGIQQNRVSLIEHIAHIRVSVVRAHMVTMFLITSKDKLVEANAKAGKKYRDKAHGVKGQVDGFYWKAIVMILQMYATGDVLNDIKMYVDAATPAECHRKSRLACIAWSCPQVQAKAFIPVLEQYVLAEMANIMNDIYM